MIVSLPKKFSAAFISKTFFPLDYKRKDLRAINSGRCYDWAYIAYCLWPEVLLWTTEHHAWVQAGNLFYDSEAHRGLKDHYSLNCNSVWPGEEVGPCVMDVESFKDFWNEHGGGRKYHWEYLVQDILDLGLKPIRN